MGRQGSRLRGAIALLLLAPGLVLAEAERRTQSVDITADTGVYTWTTNTFEFTGKAHAELTGTYEATIDAPKMVFKLTKQGDKVDSLVANGPATFVLIQTDSTGAKRKVTATAQERAEYSEVSQKLVLRGKAEATIVSLPETADAQRAHFTGEVMEANLLTSQLTVTKAHMQVTSPLPTPEGSATTTATGTP